uniref:Immunoglobulin V-set domain-containing protein n=1 Tax=Gouania willdenowi TaxID=441366 RepID=A0A8C5G8E7_GOUWI
QRTFIFLRTITAHIGNEFLLRCTYDVKMFRFNKKYWCRGESRSTCEVLSDSEDKHSHRIQVVDAGWNGLYVRVTKLQIEDTHVYWVGIDKIYADIMLAVDVNITQGRRICIKENANFEAGLSQVNLLLSSCIQAHCAATDLSEGQIFSYLIWINIFTDFSIFCTSYCCIHNILIFFNRSSCL